MGSRITIGLLVGPAVGGLIGLVVGVVWFGALGPPAESDDPLPREED